MIRRLWVWLFGPEGYGFVELVVACIAGLVVLGAACLVLLAFYVVLF